MGVAPIAMVAGLVASVLWGAWVTKTITAEQTQPRMARVQIAALISEYVQAQARTASPPDQVTAETRAFMAAVQRDLDARGKRGEVVLVGEAVLAGNVPDITGDVRKAVYAKVKMPQPAAAQANPAQSGVMDAMRAQMAEQSAGGETHGQ
jgi:hypothetical protein